MRRTPVPPTRYQRTTKAPKAGAYGVVEVWHDQLLDRDVAIKWLASSDGEEQLLNEWKMLATADSSFVAEIYDLIFDRDGTLAGIVMEYIDGVDLSAYPVPKSQDDLVAALRTLYQYAHGLADIHAKDVVHRDVKPDNGMLGADGRHRKAPARAPTSSGPKPRRQASRPHRPC